VGRTLYLQTSDQPASADETDGDVFIGHARTVADAATACAALNAGDRPAGCRWWASGGLIYPGPGAALTSGWIIACDDPELAQRIVAAVRGEAA
jgi:hypothetical protein